MRYFLILVYLISLHNHADGLFNKSELLALDKKNYNAKTVLIENPREQVVYETAFSFSAQTAFLKTLNFHEERMLNSAAELSENYNFRQLMKMTASQTQTLDPSLELVVLPAVLIKSENVQKLNKHRDILRIKDETYRIVRHSKLVTAPPTWKDYLFNEKYEAPEQPIKALIAKDDKERAIWVKGVNEGWEEGIKQANREMRNRIRALSIEWRGMLNYVSLVQKNMIVPAYISMQRTPVSKESDGMVVNELIYRITDQDRFNLNVPAWESSQGDDRKSIRSLEDTYRAAQSASGQ